MKTRIMYMELKTHDGGHDDRGDARIGRVSLSKTGNSIQYKENKFQRTNGPVGCGNYIDTASKDVYWISGPKKNGTDRFYWGKKAPVFIDDDIREEYWIEIRNTPERINDTTA